MSNYRDDVNDTAVASDTLLTRMWGIAESTAFASDTILHGLLVLHQDSAQASDEVLGRTLVLLQDEAHVADEVLGRKVARQLVADTARAADTITYRSAAPVLQDTASAGDTQTHRTRTLLVDTATAADVVLPRRTTRGLLIDTVRAADALPWHVRHLQDDAALVSEAWAGTLHAAVVVDDVATASDEVLDAYLAQVPVLVSTGRAGDALFDLLHARQLLTDTAAAEDEVLQDGAAGQAWTAHQDGWAMSRWAPLDFTGLAVIDGVLYGTNARGVFALDGQVEAMQGEIRTGLLDVGGDTTARLDGSYLEYSLDGTAELDVTQTQQGVRETCTYPLPDKPADEMTSNRFVLGRGLRSRHYAFTLRLQGTRGHINDWRLMTVPSTRRL